MRKTYLEFLRVTAVILVVFNHTRTFGYSLYTVTENAVSYWLSLSLSIFCKTAVPVFFLISGAVLLGKRESVRELFQRRVLRIVLVILAFTFLQYLRICRVNPDAGFHLSAWLLYCYCGNIIEPYWFLKEYLAMLLILPFLRILAAHMEEAHYWLLFGMKAFGTVVALVWLYSGYMLNVSFPMLTDIIFYPLAGYYLANVEKDRRVERLVGQKRFSGTGMLLTLGVVTFLADRCFQVRGEYTEAFHSVAPWLLAMLLFALVKEIRFRPGVGEKLIHAAGGCVFGVYLIEDVVRNQLAFLVPLLSRYCNEFLACLLFVLLSAAVAGGAIFAVRRLPLVRKLI